MNLNVSIHKIPMIWSDSNSHLLEDDDDVNQQWQVSSSAKRIEFWIRFSIIIIIIKKQNITAKKKIIIIIIMKWKKKEFSFYNNNNNHYSTKKKKSQIYNDNDVGHTKQTNVDIFYKW